MATFDERRPSAGRSWYRAHGLGNDYLVFEEGRDWVLTPQATRRVCDRTHGVGSDGIVLLLAGGGPPAASLRMFNPDGGEFERSGNGLRILATHLLRSGRVSLGVPFEVEVGGERVQMEVHGLLPRGHYDVSVEMGRASVDPASVGFDGETEAGVSVLALPGGEKVRFQTVSVGNPHAVVFLPEPNREALHRLGPALATNAAFARGTNVQLARPVVGERAVEALIWERGVGPTSASGTSACAVAVAAVHTGRLEAGEVEVRMEGGSLLVRVDSDLDVVLRGVVQEVGTGELAAGFLDWLAG